MQHIPLLSKEGLGVVSKRCEATFQKLAQRTDEKERWLRGLNKEPLRGTFQTTPRCALPLL